MINSIRKLVTVVSTLALMMILSGCAEEQDRILQYEKGVYLGKADQNLTQEQLQKLVLRVQWSARLLI